MIQQIDEPCTMGLHGDVIIPPSWIIKLPQKVRCPLYQLIALTYDIYYYYYYYYYYPSS